MNLTFHDERVLAVVAHPDDAELLCAGTLARAKADGAEIGVVVLCKGDAGQPEKPIRDLGAVRRREMAVAARLLGAELLTGGVPDGALADDRPTRMLLVEFFRRCRPTLVLAHWPADYHADHRAAAALAEAASWFCASRGQRTKSPALARPPALWHADALGMSGFEPGFYVDVSEFIALKEEMLACHRSQIARRGDGLHPLVDLMRQQAAARGAQAGVEAAEAFRAYHALGRSRAW